MNEQLIAKLAYETKLRTGAPTGSIEWQKIFTELIVKECANTASDFVRGPGGDHGVKKAIQEYFGVEE